MFVRHRIAIHKPTQCTSYNIVSRHYWPRSGVRFDTHDWEQTNKRTNELSLLPYCSWWTHSQVSWGTYILIHKFREEHIHKFREEKILIHTLPFFVPCELSTTGLYLYLYSSIASHVLQYLRHIIAHLNCRRSFRMFGVVCASVSGSLLTDGIASLVWPKQKYLSYFSRIYDILLIDLCPKRHL